MGDEVQATVIRTDDGQGNILLSKVEANDVLAWEKLKQYKEEGTVLDGHGKRHRQRRRHRLCGRNPRIHPGFQTFFVLCGRPEHLPESAHPGTGIRY